MTKGLIQVDKEYIVNIIMTNLKKWKDVFRSIRQIYDSDRNGFVSLDEFIEIFMSYYGS